MTRRSRASPESTHPATQVRTTKPQSQHKLEAVGELAAEVAHNLNSLLMAIIPNLQLAIPEVAPDTVELLESALQSALYASELARALVEFAGHTSVVAKQVVDATRVVESCVDVCRHTFDQGIDLVAEYPRSERFVLANFAQLGQAILNVLVNARDAVSETSVNAPTVRIVIDELQAGHDELAAVDLTPAHDYVRVRIIDNGIGMTDETRRRALDPLFTTKPLGRGIGLGLFTAKSIVSQHGGAIVCTSSLGAGSTFTIYLPSSVTRDPAVGE